MLMMIFMALKEDPEGALGNSRLGRGPIDKLDFVERKEVIPTTMMARQCQQIMGYHFHPQYSQNCPMRVRA